MATRDLTEKYLQHRSLNVNSPYFETPTQSMWNSASDDERALVSRSSLQLEQGSSKEMKFWEKIMVNVEHDIEDIKRRMVTLNEHHREHTTHRTGKTNDQMAQEEIQIEAHTAEIHRLFQLCKANVSKLEQKTKSREEDILLNNLKMKLVTELNELSKEFRKSQQEYLKQLRALKSRRKELNSVDYALDSDEEEEARMDEMLMNLDKGFSEEQVEQMIHNEREVMRRDKELKEILRSILEVQELLKDFSSLVVEQGTMLDRIDYNIEKAHNYVKKGNKELRTSEKYQKCSRWLIVAILLTVVVIVVCGILFLKLGLRYGPQLLKLLALVAALAA